MQYASSCLVVTHDGRRAQGAPASPAPATRSYLCAEDLAAPASGDRSIRSQREHPLVEESAVRKKKILDKKDALATRGAAAIEGIEQVLIFTT